jgi:hypothetical protein
MRIVAAVIVWVGAIVAAATLSSVVAGGVHQPAGGAAAAPSNFDAGAVTSAGSHSLFRTANFTPVLAKARAHLGTSARIEEVVIYPGYVDVSATRPGGEIDVYIDAIGRYEPTTDDTSPHGTPLFSLARITPDMPAALGQRIATAAHIPQSQLHYMIAERDSITHRFHWLIYMRSGSPVEYFETPGPTGPLYEYRAGSSTGLQRVHGT